MKNIARFFPRVFHSFFKFVASVRFRLTLWYVALMAFIVLLFGASLYASETVLSSAVIQSRLEAQLYQDSQSLENVYKPALLAGTRPGSRSPALSSDEIVLLLRADSSILEKRGTLPNTTTQMLQAMSRSNLLTADVALPQAQPSHWHGFDNTYHVMITPIIDKHVHIATLIVGLPRGGSLSLLTVWFFHGLITLLITSLGGYWLAGKALRPVKLITRTAREIHATDLRRRLNLRHHDEFGELAATFDQMLARLEAAFKRQTQFTADASHELRTPLTIIDLEINRALTQLHTPAEYQMALHHLQAENEQMAAIVNSLLLLARADTGQMTLHHEEIDLSDLALACVERLLPLAREKQITLSTGQLPELLVCGDSYYLSRMLMNLIENAIKYTSGVGTRVHVELKENAEGIVRVEDDGPGIDDEHLPYLFDRFYRVDKARTRNPQTEKDDTEQTEQPGGSGLGLAIAQWIAQAHNGTICVESTPGNGSVFEVCLPLLKQETSNKQTACSETTGSLQEETRNSSIK